MLQAFLYLIISSGRNRVRRHLGRLRQPRYALATTAGLLYFGFLILRPRGSVRTPTALPFSQAATELLAAALLFVVVAVAWLRPAAGGAALSFSRSDVQWLFPAPVTRRHLIEYMILRTQLGALFSAAIMAIFAGPPGLVRGVSFFVGFWVSAATVSLHLSGVALSRARLVQFGARGPASQWLPLAVMAGSTVAIASSIAGGWTHITAAATTGAAVQAVHDALSQGPAAIVLWPLQVLVRVTLSPALSSSLGALPFALGLLALHIAWVVQSDAAFEEASADRAESVARAAAARRSTAPPPRTRRAVPFALSPTGRPEMALLWKNLILFGRYSRTTAIAFLVPMVVVIAVARSNAGSAGASGAAWLSLGLTIAIVVLGPMMLRNDLRQDLAHLAILKTWPVRGVSLVIGAVLAPAVVLSVLAGFGIVATAILGGAAAEPLADAGTTRLSAAVAAMLVAPALILTLLMVCNGLAIVFPAWHRIREPRTSGVEMMGQSMMTTIGALLAVAFAIVPAVALAGAAMFAIRAAVGVPPVFVPAAIVAAVLLAECLLAMVALGWALDRTDISAVEAAA